MSRNEKYQFFVEGECEKKLIDELKKQQTMIVSGRVNVFNVTQNELPNALLANLSNRTVVILVFDTDRQDAITLRKNIQKLRKYRNVKDIWCVMQVRNLEDELVSATDVREIKELFDCKSNSDFKRDFLKEKKLMEKLKRHSFNFGLFWNKKPSGVFSEFENCGNRVKLHNKN